MNRIQRMRTETLVETINAYTRVSALYDAGSRELKQELQAMKAELATRTEQPAGLEDLSA